MEWTRLTLGETIYIYIYLKNSFWREHSTYNEVRGIQNSLSLLANSAPCVACHRHLSIAWISTQITGPSPKFVMNIVSFGVCWISGVCISDRMYFKTDVIQNEHIPNRMCLVPPGPRRRAPTPAGNLLGRPMFEDEEEEDEKGFSTGLGKAGGSEQFVAHDVDLCRDQNSRGSQHGEELSSSILALKRSGSLAARRRYEQSAAALGEGVGVGVGVASLEAGPEASKGRLSVKDSAGMSATTAFGSWVVIDGGGVRAHISSLEVRQEPGPHPTSPPHVLQPPQSTVSSTIVGEEEDDLAHLMCDECDFVTPPHSPTAAKQGAPGLV
jgi:hypothetical protein